MEATRATEPGLRARLSALAASVGIPLAVLGLGLVVAVGTVDGVDRTLLIALLVLWVLTTASLVVGCVLLVRSVLRGLEAVRGLATSLADGELEEAAAPELPEPFGATTAALERLRSTLLERTATSELLVDPVTGWYGTQEFRRRLSEEVARARRHDRRVTLALVELDGTDGLVEQPGSGVAAGELARHVAKTIQAAVRPMDVLARTGETSFALLLPETGSDGGVTVAERVRSAVAASPLETGTGAARLRTSVGVATCPEHASTDEHLHQATQEALLTARERGGDTVTVFGRGVG